MTSNEQKLGWTSIALMLALGCGDSGTGEAGDEADTSSGTDESGESGTETGTTAGTSEDTTDAETTISDTTDADTTADTTDADTTADTTDATTTDTTDTTEETTEGAVCSDLDCSECYACALDDDSICADEKAACEDDPDCVDLAACVADCPPVGDPDFEQCHDDCVDGMPGEGAFKDLGACLACDTCNCGNHPEC